MANIFLYLIVFLILFSQNLVLSEESKDDELNKPKFYIGKQYKLKGKWHYPKNNLEYSEIGIASVNKKKNKKTINDEIFSNNKILAKHKTLALPTIVRVTNLDNGYTINVRINDRGPKNNYRIIELSKKAANYLKINEKGLVKITVVSDLSLQEQNKIKNKNKDFSNENLEENVVLKKEIVETENLMDVDKIDVKKDNNLVRNNKKFKRLKLNYKKIDVPPYYLRVDITKFKKFKDAANLKDKLKPIYDKILISLNLINNQKYYKVTTVPINNLQEAEDILKVIHKKGFNNAKLFIDRKIK